MRPRKCHAAKGVKSSRQSRQHQLPPLPSFEGGNLIVSCRYRLMMLAIPEKNIPDTTIIAISAVPPVSGSVDQR